MNPKSPAWSYSICSTGMKSNPLLKVLDTARSLGLAGVELWSEHAEDFLSQGGTYAEIRGHLEVRELAVPALAAYTSFSKSPLDIEEDMKQIARAAELASSIGSPRIRTFAGHVPSVKANREDWNMTVEGLRHAANLCARSKVKLAVEIHNNTFADRLDQIRSLIEEVGDSNLELIYDPFNLYVDHQDRLDVLEQLYPWIAHVHFKNYMWNHDNWNLSEPVSVLQGDCDHWSLIKQLLERNYTGFISFEYFGENSADLARRSLVEIQTHLI